MKGFVFSGVNPMRYVIPAPAQYLTTTDCNEFTLNANLLCPLFHYKL
jgi:hypothetical protein